MNPKISVLMPAFNASNFVSQAINSVLNQTFFDFELIIIDDASTDNTWNLISAYDDTRIRKYRNTHNQGISFTRNALIELAKGKYIAWLDADDISAENRLEVQFNFLENNIDYVFIGTSAIIVDVHGQYKGEWVFVNDCEYLKIGLMFKNQFVQSSVMVRSDIIKKVTYDISAQPVEDFLMWYRLTKYGKATNLKECLVSYRIHSSGATLSRFEFNERGVAYVLRLIFEDMDLDYSETEFLIHHRFSFPGHFTLHRTRFSDVLNWMKKIEEVLIQKRISDRVSVTKYISKELIKILPYFGRFDILRTLPVFLFYYGIRIDSISSLKLMFYRAFIRRRVLVSNS